MRMVQVSHRLGFPLETSDSDRICLVIGSKNLYRNFLTIQNQVLGQIDICHTSAANLLDDFISPGKDFADLNHALSSLSKRTRATVMLSSPPALLAKRIKVSVFSDRLMSLVTMSQISLSEIILVRPSLLSRR